MYIASKFNSERISLVDIGVASTPTFYPGSPGLGDSLYPNFGNGGYDVQKYTINLDISDPLISTLAGVTIIEATTTQALSSFNLDLIGFDVASIVINDEPATFTREGQELIITPTAPLAEGEAFTASITYSGSPEQINSVAFFWPTPVGWVIFDGGSFVRSQPEGAATYYPVNDHPLDLATYTFQVTVPSEFEVAANGVLEQTINNGDTTTYVFEARDPMASYLSTVNIAEGFKLDTSVSDSGVLIRNYFSETIPDEQLSAFDLQPKMIDFLSSIIGPYPFEVYGSVVLDTEITVGAMESQTLSLFGTEALNADIPLEEIIVHEAAHQWFGNALPLGDWSDIWLNEGFATYAQGLWVEYTQGAEALDAWVKNTYGSLRTSFFAESPGDPPAGNLFNDGVYGGGFSLARFADRSRG